jgi:hypothetical protein
MSASAELTRRRREAGSKLPCTHCEVRNRQGLCLLCGKCRYRRDSYGNLESTGHLHLKYVRRFMHHVAVWEKRYPEAFAKADEKLMHAVAILGAAEASRPRPRAAYPALVKVATDARWRTLSLRMLHRRP